MLQVHGGITSRKRRERKRRKRQRAAAKTLAGYRVNEGLSEMWRKCEIVEHAVDKSELPISDSGYGGSKKKVDTKQRRILPLLRALLEHDFVLIQWDGRYVPCTITLNVKERSRFIGSDIPLWGRTRSSAC